MLGCGLDSTASAQDLQEDFCDHGNEPRVP
jgi:hypothetical protein